MEPIIQREITRWHSYNGKKRYFRLSDDENYAYMDVGRKKIGSETYYFDKNGYN